MKKPVKVLSAAALAAVFAASSITPVMAAEVAAQKDIQNVIFDIDGKLISVPLTEVDDKSFDFEIPLNSVKYFELSNGDIYLLSDLDDALFEVEPNNVFGAIDYLVKNNKPADVTPLDGKVDEDGNVVVGDETPEEKVNETFFYNLAA